ncbi:Zn-ribbon domain-containing OB-fold protein [Rhodococcus wratislaviensis]|uniref:DUF35 domain-containing protein n=1 Tax=Rhodococcus wratislaviensis NBRC 100605 TaxID=1219028 RepID=X0RER8_RHOWR|nr:OB-fold domain-containing protein [Rhodococcus wratislaviensis]GAF49530.1 hypothetical protein RW1_093_00170 [Rhodococcus wratislaviensis NBRC 100605]
MISIEKSGFVPPTPSIDTAGWWKAMAAGNLTMPECGECSSRFFPPQPRCSRCGASDWTLEPTDGRGSVYSWVVANRAFGEEFVDDVPYGIVAVDLVDGGRIIGRFAEDPALLRDGLRVEAVVQRFDEFGLLWFKSVEASED